jgi:CheY-like chemotaxis protein
MPQTVTEIKDKLKGWTVLLVDDEPDNLEYASHWLTQAGANVITARNGRQGLDLARQTNPDFILADLTMPIMDGWDMQYDLKNDLTMSHIPVIAFTGHHMEGVKGRVLEAGFVDHITKPFNGQKFIEQLCEIVARFSNRPEPSS